jgi:hypothetical protein
MPAASGYFWADALPQNAISAIDTIAAARVISASTIEVEASGNSS